MLWEDNYLAHHGIKLQRWGVRRFQDKNGKLTPEGRLRYGLPAKKSELSKKVKDTAQKIKSGASNNIPTLEIKNADLERVKQRGELTDKEALACIKLANRMVEEASAIEPAITKDVVSSIEESGSVAYGLENRVKQPSSLAAKIGADAKEKEISFKESSKQIKDTIRYTSLSGDNDFTNNYYSIKNFLEGKGYTEVRCRNYFAFYKEGKAMHKSVQCAFIDQDGNIFELQFQTPSSQAVKDLKVPLYEERRSSSVTQERKEEIEKMMFDLAENIAYPKNVFDIKSHG